MTHHVIAITHETKKNDFDRRNRMPTKPKVEAAAEPNEKAQSQMMELLRKVMLATMGAAVIAQEEVEVLINRLIERGEIAEKDGKKLMHEMMDKRKSKSSQVQDEINRNITDVLERMNIPTRTDFDTLSQKINGLSKKIDELKKA
jgi:poly(hydroxyalkanoate) granule-associated protein